MAGTIWIVDDDENIRDSLGRTLNEFGYGVEAFPSGREMLARLGSHSPDLFIVDVRMPEMSGMDLTRAITEKDPRAIVIVLTGYPSIEDAIEAIQIGAADYLAKPFDKAQLRIRVENLLGMRRLQNRLKHTTTANRTLLESLPVWIVLGMLLARFLW